MSSVKSSVQLSTKQLIELLFSSQAIGHCKTPPTLQHGFLVQVKHKRLDSISLSSVHFCSDFATDFFLSTPQKNLESNKLHDAVKV